MNKTDVKEVSEIPH
ncbi:hypothetical protein LZ654_02655 [Lelliottia amnigena]|nr:hypothetical protein [Lelliottia amnigena]